MFFYYFKIDLRVLSSSNSTDQTMRCFVQNKWQFLKSKQLNNFGVYFLPPHNEKCFRRECKKIVLKLFSFKNLHKNQISSFKKSKQNNLNVDSFKKPLIGNGFNKPKGNDAKCLFNVLTQIQVIEKNFLKSLKR